ncbi:MAG TPA: methyltransferase domain-containing protein [Rhizomicrobium sp.]|jgi:SAM-dependent methyltransferase
MSEKSYVIGTHDAEIGRLGLQHAVWRPSVTEFWRLGGIAAGQTVIDAGAGPGYGTLELAEIVGPEGRVIGVERSRRFLDALAERTDGHPNVRAIEADLLDYDWPEAVADRIWCRWVLAFVSDPARVVAGMARALKPGGALLIQEYWDYASWRLAPRAMEFEAYIGKIIASWRAAGGEPDIALDLPRLFAANGLTVEMVRPVVFTAPAHEFAWQWPAAFARASAEVMAERGEITPEESHRIDAILTDHEADPNAFVVTPGVLQIVARKP